MKRYQNPDIFEHLAMSYALGTLRGKARSRFETLMAQRLYLRAVTESYQQRLMPLVELLPPEPAPPQVWNNIARHLQQTRRNSLDSLATRPAWLNNVLPWSMTAFASVLAAVLTVLALNQQAAQPNAYMAMLKSPSQPDKMLVATVKRANMTLSLDMPAHTMPEAEGMTPVLWCIPKDAKLALMRMGELDHAHSMPIDKQTWRDMAHIRELAISLEPNNTNAAKPLGKIVFNGKLSGM
jgi:anti-sigma-K factor RskA